MVNGLKVVAVAVAVVVVVAVAVAVAAITNIDISTTRNGFSRRLSGANSHITITMGKRRSSNGKNRNSSSNKKAIEW